MRNPQRTRLLRANRKRPVPARLARHALDLEKIKRQRAKLAELKEELALERRKLTKKISGYHHGSQYDSRVATRIVPIERKIAVAQAALRKMGLRFIEKRRKR